jgi:hypothetical protein
MGMQGGGEWGKMQGQLAETPPSQGAWRSQDPGPGKILSCPEASMASVRIDIAGKTVGGFGNA